MRTHEEAQDRANRISDSLEAALEDLVGAWEDEDHLTLGYETWASYCEDVLGGWKPPKDKRLEIVRVMSEAGATQRDIAAVVGTTHVTVGNDLKKLDPGKNLPSPDPLHTAVETWKMTHTTRFITELTQAEEFVDALAQGPENLVDGADSDEEFEEWITRIEAMHTKLSAIIQQVRGERHV